MAQMSPLFQYIVLLCIIIQTEENPTKILGNILQNYDILLSGSLEKIIKNFHPNAHFVFAEEDIILDSKDVNSGGIFLI